MGLETNIADGTGSERLAQVDEHNHLGVALYPPALHLDGKPSTFRFYAQYLGSGGAEAAAINGGAADQGVNGSVTTQNFFIAAEEDFDIRIMAISIVIADTAIVHNNFGNVSALTNGWDLIIEEAGAQTFIINKAKTGGQVIAQSGFYSPYGDGATSFELTNWTSNEDAQTINLPIGTVVPGGVRIGRGTNDRILAVVNDDLTGLTEFYVRIAGYRHYP